MIIVVADDITGAAEIAGIAHRHNLRSVLTTSVPSTVEGTDVLVIATDARSYGPKEAYEMTAEVARQVAPFINNGASLFRKTDSALRGNVKEELQAILDNTPYERALYMPANPSKGRIIRDGIYYINGTPISETDFRFDPEFPAFSSKVEERLSPPQKKGGVSVNTLNTVIQYANAESQADVEAVVRSADKKTLFAGAADLFEALLNSNVYSNSHSSLFALHSSLIIVRGSTQSKAIPLDIPTEVMPHDVFYEESKPCTWAASIIDRYRREGSVILAIGDKEVRQGKHAAVYLREAMAEVCLALLDAHQPKELIIEGGATAFAILSKLPWHSFSITDEIAPGVVRMQPDGVDIHITMKPGSYSWGKMWPDSQTSSKGGE